ncbi:DUF2793 domain-containing protein [uncultured Pelagimonas sp.]|uniref:DUF2793 domain-containing protein n=1 Tax=uncultured Pelagimonas sp. TaxID=1618102 RepID=UPI002613D2F0|nr:DUF2793 domain-containing protein [uncultured Pelagimonas sp.]
MADTTDRLGLPLIAAGQAQKHVTHNEALRLLDAQVQLSVLSKLETSPPVSAGDGNAYIVATGATGDWLGHDNQIAVLQAGQWIFFVPGEGWIAYVIDEDRPYRFIAAWAQLPMSDQTNRLGVNTTADDTNRLAVSSPATLFTHSGAGHQIKVNKNAATDTASLLFQTGWSGRAEMGTAGSDGFAIKVSDDGNSWKTGLSIAAGTGIVTAPQGMNSGMISGVGDNTAFGIPIPAEQLASGVIFIFSEDQNYPQPGVNAALWFDVGLSLSFAPISVGSRVDLTTGVLSGDTGADGRMTIAVDTRQIHVENRLGSQRAFRWFLIN